MSGTPLYIMLISGEHEKIQTAAMMASVAAVSDRPVHVFVSMNAIYAFEKGIDDGQRYHGGRMSNVMLEKKVPDAMGLFEQGRMLGEMTMYACSMALDVMHWEMENLVDGLFDGPMGLTKFLSDAESGQFITL